MCRVHVAVGVIFDGAGRVLLSRRHRNSHQGGRWEFPGGKVETGEDVVTALRRELLEELGIQLRSAEALIDAWEGMKFDGPKGEVYIRPEDHVAIQDMYVMKLLNVDDPDAMYFEFITTTRPEPPCLLPEDLKDRCGDLPYGSLTGE